MSDAQVVAPDAGSPPAADAMPVPSEDDAGSEWVPPEPVCTDGAWRLAPGFLLARRVDYIADRETPPVVDELVPRPTVVWSEAGMPCASAMRREHCLAGLKLPGGVGRHLITTAGDSVQLWNAEVALKVLGMIDTPAEAVWWLIAQRGYLLPCGAQVQETEYGYSIKGALSTICGETPNSTHRPLEILVQRGGTLSDFGPVNSGDPVCAAPP